MSVETLLAIEEIKKLKARYFRHLDDKAMENLGALFTDDAVIDVQGSVNSDDGADTAIENFEQGAEKIIGGKAFIAFVSSINGNLRSVHHGHCPEITITSPNSATGIWAMEDHIWFSSGAVAKLHGYGHYHESYRRLETGEWKICAMKITRLRVDMYPA